MPARSTGPGQGPGDPAGDGARAQPARVQDDVRPLSRDRGVGRAREERPRAPGREPRAGRPLRRPGRHPAVDRGRAVGHREQLRQEPRRLRGHRCAGDPGLQQLPRPVLPPAADRGAEDPGPGPCLLRRHEGLVGGRDGPVPVHPDQLPRLCRRRRRRWPHGHLDQQGRRLRLDHELPAARRLEARPGVGPGGAGRHAGGAGRAHRAAGRGGRPDLPARRRTSRPSCAGTSRISSRSPSGCCPTRSLRPR